MLIYLDCEGRGRGGRERGGRGGRLGEGGREGGTEGGRGGEGGITVMPVNPSRITPVDLRRLIRSGHVAYYLADGMAPTGKVLVISCITLCKINSKRPW